MAKKSTEQLYQSLLSSILKGSFKPLYLLMGEEPYYIDTLTQAIVDHALEESERDFNQTIVYGAEIDEIGVVINAAKRYPMMAQRQLVVVKEAQLIHNLEPLCYYLQQPQPSTVLVICHKGGAVKSKKLLALAEKVGEVFESNKLQEYQLVPFITKYLTNKQCSIEPKAATMLADAVGRNLSRLTGDLDKLRLLLPQQDSPLITAQLVEENIGISKEFNNFELLNAIAVKDSYKVNQIALHFKKNPRNNPLVLTLSMLFNFFANLMQLYFARCKSEQDIMQELGFKSIYQAKSYAVALGRYNAFKCIDIISDIRKCDVRSKGIEGSQAEDSELLKELLFRIIH